MNNAVNALLVGATLAICLVIGLFFLRFWLTTRDRFFLCFAFSFWLQGLNQLVLLASAENESRPEYYLLRVVAYALIVAGIAGRNIRRRKLRQPAA